MGKEQDRLIKLVADEALKQWLRLYPMAEYVDQVSALRRMGDEILELRKRVYMNATAIIKGQQA